MAEDNNHPCVEEAGDATSPPAEDLELAETKGAEGNQAAEAVSSDPPWPLTASAAAAAAAAAAATRGPSARERSKDEVEKGVTSDEDEKEEPGAPAQPFRGARLTNCSSFLVSQSEEFMLVEGGGVSLHRGINRAEGLKKEGDTAKARQDTEEAKSETDRRCLPTLVAIASGTNARGPSSDGSLKAKDEDKNEVSSSQTQGSAAKRSEMSTSSSTLAQVGCRVSEASLRRKSSLTMKRRSTSSNCVEGSTDEFLRGRPSYARVPSYMRRLDELTLNKLQFSKLGKLYGREVECQQVLDAWRDTCLAWVHAATTLSSADSSPDEEAAGAPTQSRATPAASPSFDAGGSKSPLSGSRRVVVAIHGEAGAGKTRLAESVRAKAVGDGGLFLTGKFCQPTQSQLSDGGHHCHQQLQLGGVEPYSAFASACFDLWQSPTDENPEPSQARRRRSVLFTSTVNQLQQGSINGDGDEEESPLLLTHGQFLARVSKEIGDKDAAHLIRVIPGLAPLLQRQGITSSTPQASGPPETIEHKKSDLQFKLAFRRLIRLVSKMKPICLVIDDLQWADSGSLELLERLLSDPEELSLMVVVCYREEVPGAHLKTLESIRAMGVSPDIGVRVENIRVGNLDANHLNELLTDLLSLPESETQGLATCICKKTLGNVFFVTQFLGMLQASKLLKYNIGTLKWTFSLLAIQDSMGATDNAANLVKVKFKHLPKSVVRVLPAMACLGLTVQIEMFELALNHCEWPVEPEVSSIDEEARDPEDFQPLESKASLLLKQCEAEGLLEARMGHEDVSYRWVHDKIQEAAFSLIDYPDLQELKLSIGKVLCEKLDPEALEANLFLVANLLISFDPVSGSTIFEEPVKVVELFHWAGSKAMNSSAFELALGYLQAGIKVLPDNHWETHEALSLELYSTAAEAAFGLGDFGTSQQYYDEAILRTPGLPLADRRRVYDVMIACTAAQQGIEAGFYACKSLLARLGCVFPRRWVAPLHVLASLLRIKISRRRNLPETILQRGELHHPTTIWIMSLLDRLATYAYVTDPTLLCVILFRCINITLQEGICQYSPAIFALVGFLLSAFMNDYGRGHAFATHAIDLLHHVKSASRVESRVTFLAHAFVFHWTRPFQFSVKPLLASFSAGMASGDTESAALSINLYLEYCFRMGTPLPILLEDYAHYTKLIRDVNQTKILAIIVNLWQVVFFLTGQNEFTGPLTGDIVNQESALLDVSAEDFNYLFFAINRMQMYAAFVLGKHIEVYKSIIRTSFSAGAYERIFPGIFGLIHLYAYNGLSMFSLYRESNDKKYLKLAKKFAAMIKKWARSGNPNVFHYDALLDADADALSATKLQSAIMNRFEAAIQYAGKCGLLHDRALAHERYSEYLSRLGAVHDDDASFQLSEAMRLYKEWGAHAKVKQLTEVHDARYGSTYSDSICKLHPLLG